MLILRRSMSLVALCLAVSLAPHPGVGAEGDQNTPVPPALSFDEQLDREDWFTKTFGDPSRSAANVTAGTSAAPVAPAPMPPAKPILPAEGQRDLIVTIQPPPR